MASNTDSPSRDVNAREEQRRFLTHFCGKYFKGKRIADATARLARMIPTASSGRPGGEDGADPPSHSALFLTIADDLAATTETLQAFSLPAHGTTGWSSKFSKTRLRVARFLRGFDLISNNLRLSAYDRRNHLMFYALIFLSFAANVVSLFVSGQALESQSCNILIPNDSDDCCQCVCDVVSAWCATLPTKYGNVTGPHGHQIVPLDVYGNYYSATNSVENTSEFRKYGVAAVYCMSLLFTLVELSIARVRGNWHMLLCVCTVMILQGSRNLYLHFPSHDWNDFVAAAAIDDIVVLAADALSIVSAILATAWLRALRPAFLTTQFQNFGRLLSHQRTLNNYNVMFAMALLDWQTSSLLYFQMGILASNNVAVIASMAMMYMCDVLSSYLAYSYIRFEKYNDTVVALVSKSILAVSWLVMSAYVVWCYDLFRARALYLRATLLASQYLGVDAADTQAYLLGSCGISPVVSGSGDVIVMFCCLAIAFFVRVIAVFYAALLSADFGTNIIMALFFDVVGIQQKKGLPLYVQLPDTLDIQKQ